MKQSSRSLAQTWGYPRHRHFISQVRTAAADWFQSRKLRVNPKYPYILSEWSDWPNNIILMEVVDYINRVSESQRKQGLNFPLHKYVHHGLSSQAMLFNLAGPLLVQGDLQPLRTIIERKGLKWPSGNSRAMFEYEDRTIFNEDRGQPTSIDMVISNNQNQPKIFIESKFVEQEFGGCSLFGAGDCDGQNPVNNVNMCYLHHIGRKYWTLIKKYGIDDGPVGQDTLCILANHYQFFREVIFALEHQGIFVLLCDERSPVFYTDGPQGARGVMPFLAGMLPEQLRPFVSYVTVQELVAEIDASNRHEWIGDFKKKYGL